MSSAFGADPSCQHRSLPCPPAARRVWCLRHQQVCLSLSQPSAVCALGRGFNHSGRGDLEPVLVWPCPALSREVAWGSWAPGFVLAAIGMLPENPFLTLLTCTFSDLLQGCLPAYTTQLGVCTGVCGNVHPCVGACTCVCGGMHLPVCGHEGPGEWGRHSQLQQWARPPRWGCLVGV